MHEDTPRVAISLVNWNNFADTKDCLQSLQQIEYQNLQVIVVDNGSTDGSFEALKKEFEWITLIQCEQNLGFSGGHNKAIRQALTEEFDYVLILNNDVIIPDSGSIRKLITEMESDDGLGILSPTITEYPNTNETWFQRGVVHWPSGRTEQVTRSDRTSEGLIINDYVPFCAVLIRMGIFEEVGLLSETFFLYYEDVDFCYHVRQAGYNIATDPSTEVYHKVSNSTGSGYGSLGSYYGARNRILFARRAGRAGTAFYLLYLVWIVSRTIHRLVTGRIDGAIGLIQGGIDGLLGRSGRGVYP